MVVQRGDLACCVRCAGPASAERLARRQLLRAAVHPPAPGPLVPVATAGVPPLPSALPSAVTLTPVCTDDESPRLAVVSPDAFWSCSTATS